MPPPMPVIIPMMVAPTTGTPASCARSVPVAVNRPRPAASSTSTLRRSRSNCGWNQNSREEAIRRGGPDQQVADDPAAQRGGDADEDDSQDVEPLGDPGRRAGAGEDGHADEVGGHARASALMRGQ